ncbi:hypothetical protein [Asticcacaulis sp. AC466]|uniref:hypothetical protein n=1 Tax=Asticcacaulis sp. AC466 TaxID=1282362 RepID=UPI0012DE4A01|nr:hypothetical protein [Asticcacaulis sp. AC466]
MAITIESASEAVISPSELLEWAHDNIDPSDPDNIMDAGPMLTALSNNRTFIRNAILDQLRTLSGYAPSGRAKMISGQSFIFGGLGAFTIRANIWSKPKVVNARAQRYVDKIYSYTTPHDHNFALLTVGYQGAGYATSIFEYDREKVSGFVGEVVDIRFLEHTTLSKGKILYYRPSKDIHIQKYPEETSVSLNLILDTPALKKFEQYAFDVEECKIRGLLYGSFVLRQLSLLKVSSLLIGSDEEAVAEISNIARNHYSPYVRLIAFQGLLDADTRHNLDRDMITHCMRRDPNPIVNLNAAVSIY